MLKSLYRLFLRVKQTEHSRSSTVYVYDKKTRYSSDQFIFINMINKSTIKVSKLNWPVTLTGPLNARINIKSVRFT
jgi:hypothetical protein